MNTDSHFRAPRPERRVGRLISDVYKYQPQARPRRSSILTTSNVPKKAKPQLSRKSGRKPSVASTPYRLRSSQLPPVLARSTKTSARPLPSRKSHSWIMWLLIIVVVAGFGTHTVLKQKAHARQVAAALAATTARQQRITDLDSKVQAVLAQYPGITFSVSLVDLHDNQAKHIGSNKIFIAASTGKLITATDYLSEVQKGNRTLSRQIDGQSAASLLQKMVVDSDNDAWASLNDNLGHQSLLSYASNAIGMQHYNTDDNTLTSDDMALLLQKLYQGKLLNKTYTQQLLGYMKRANYRQFAVAAVPTVDTIYHKIGDLDDLVHDATIITHSQDAFVMAIYTDGNGDYSWDTRAAAIKSITSLAIKAYLNN